jgi:hypothetical protein
MTITTVSLILVPIPALSLFHSKDIRSTSISAYNHRCLQEGVFTNMQKLIKYIFGINYLGIRDDRDLGIWAIAHSLSSQVLPPKRQS